MNLSQVSLDLHDSSLAFQNTKVWYGRSNENLWRWKSVITGHVIKDSFRICDKICI